MYMAWDICARFTPRDGSQDDAGQRGMVSRALFVLADQALMLPRFLNIQGSLSEYLLAWCGEAYLWALHRCRPVL